MSDKILIPNQRPREEFPNVRATKTGRRYVVAEELLKRKSVREQIEAVKQIKAE